jgi:hypothetical protein
VKSSPKSPAVETAEYIAGMAREMRVMASTADLGFLAYLLSMVEAEANNELHKRPVTKKPGVSAA